MEPDSLVGAQRAYFQSGATRPLSARRQALLALRRAVALHQDDIARALFLDLGKSKSEAYLTETGLVLQELSFLLRRLPSLAAPKRVKTPPALFPATSRVMRVPFGVTLILSPWNYPVLLTLQPLASALAAGNTAILKPSAYAPATSALLARLAEQAFDSRLVAVVQGGREQNAALLEQAYDMIFFTGGETVGRLVLEKAAQHLTPTVLELGGKSPVYVDESADLPLAARRIVFGKLLCAGQTCVAPDYVLCHESIRDRLVKELTRQIRLMWGKEPLRNPDLPRIVNRRHFERLCGYLTQGTVETGGDTNPETLQISPTVLSPRSWDDPVMQEEIFGPILPVMTYSDFEAMLAQLRRRPKPLAGYLFTRSQAHEDAFLRRLSFGGGCINDVISHLVTTCLPFGGVGESGMGSYHGRKSFEAFSHTKPMLKKSLRVDMPVRYPPYKKKLKWLKKLSK